MKSYDTAEYAKSRLVETVIRHGDEPVLVLDVGYFIPFGTDETKIMVKYQTVLDEGLGDDYLENFNLDPVALGYTNYKNIAYYLTRMPMRKDWRQGVRMLNVVMPDGDRPPVSMKVIGETIKGNYPSFKSCLDKLNSKKAIRSIAFSRDFAVSSIDLEYKGLFSVGKVDMENGAIHLNDDMGWVREALDQSLEIAA